MNQKWQRIIMSFLADARAAVSSEHALLLTLIALGIFFAVTFFGTTVSQTLYQTSISLLPFGS
jgi:Flp pilus assembly pilin Flp